MRIAPLLLSGALLLAASSDASAQVIATSFEELRALVQAGDTIQITDASGRRTKGKLGDLSASSLELLVSQRDREGRDTRVARPLTEADVTQIVRQRRDPPWKGMLWGAAVVGGPWLLVCNPATSWCEYGESGAEDLFRVAALMTTGMSAGIGALIDALIVEKTTVYYRAPQPRTADVRIAPLLSKSQAGMQLLVKF